MRVGRGRHTHTHTHTHTVPLLSCSFPCSLSRRDSATFFFLFFSIHRSERIQSPRGRTRTPCHHSSACQRSLAIQSAHTTCPHCSYKYMCLLRQVCFVHFQMNRMKTRTLFPNLFRVGSKYNVDTTSMNLSSLMSTAKQRKMPGSGRHSSESVHELHPRKDRYARIESSRIESVSISLGEASPTHPTHTRRTWITLDRLLAIASMSRVLQGLSQVLVV